jgi:hypothetical protein
MTNQQVRNIFENSAKFSKLSNVNRARVQRRIENMEGSISGLSTPSSSRPSSSSRKSRRSRKNRR